MSELSEQRFLSTIYFIKDGFMNSEFGNSYYKILYVLREKKVDIIIEIITLNNKFKKKIISMELWDL